MKIKELTAIRANNINEIKKQVYDLDKILAKMLIEKNIKPERNSRASKNIRRKIAVYKTIIREKELAHGNK